MKRLLLLVPLLITACSYVPPGNVGVKVNALGGQKGVANEILPVGRYWLGPNETLFLFPTFEQNYVWTKSEHEGNKHDESFTFQDINGTEINADIGISYHVIPEKVATVFQKYQRGMDEITGIFVRNHVRDALNKVASMMTVDEIYGAKKSTLMSEVEKHVRSEVEPQGLFITKIYIVGSVRLPEMITKALNSKIEATQKAQQTENELRETRAAAEKVVAQAEGEAKSIRAKADAQADANRKIAASLTSTLVEYEKVKKWDGALPTVSGAGASLIDLRSK